MAAGEAEQVKRALIAAAKPATTPVALAENVSLPGSKSVMGTLAELPDLAQRLGDGPALVLIGSVFGIRGQGANSVCAYGQTSSHPDPELRSSEGEVQRVQEKRGEPGERPFGDREAEEGPVHHRAFAGS
jgi:hypothetical protein